MSWSRHTISHARLAALPSTAALLRLQLRLNRHLGLRLSCLLRSLHPSGGPSASVSARISRTGTVPRSRKRAAGRTSRATAA